LLLLLLLPLLLLFCCLQVAKLVARKRRRTRKGAGAAFARPRAETKRSARTDRWGLSFDLCNRLLVGLLLAGVVVVVGCSRQAPQR
jgi:hypothetical protein